MRANHRLASLLLVLGVGGCGEHPVDPVDATLAGAQRQTRTLEARTAIDLLFVIDDSGSMCEEQDSLAHNFRALSDLFFDRLGPAADLRVASERFQALLLARLTP